MNSNQDNNQSDNGGNVKPHDGTANWDNTGSPTGNEHKDIGDRLSNDATGGLPRSPRGKQLSADENMNDDTGLSNRVNRQPAEPATEARQDGTPD